MNAIDTNVLVYAFDTAYPEKHKAAQAIVRDIFNGKQEAVVTNQILAEFAAVVTRKIEKSMQKEDAGAIVEAIIASGNWQILNYTEKTVVHALKSKESFWDALIAQTLLENNVKTIITENGKHFTSIRAVNPFN